MEACEPKVLEVLRVNPTDQDIHDIAEVVPAGPVVMLNLFKFKPTIDPRMFLVELRRLNEPFAERAKAEVIYSGPAGHDFLSDEEWDFIILVRYPSYTAFMELVTDPQWAATAGVLRDESLEDAKLILSSSAER